MPPPINLKALIEANSTLAHEKRELMNIIKLLLSTIVSMSNGMTSYGKICEEEISKYKSIPKGFKTVATKNYLEMNAIAEQSKRVVSRIEFVGKNDELTGKEYYNSLIDELNRNANQPKNIDTHWFLHGFTNNGVSWNFFKSKADDRQIDEYYKKHKKDIDKLISDQLNKLFPFIDPQNLGGDIEGEWQDGMHPEDDSGDDGA